MSADIVSVYKEASAKIRSLRTTMASEAQLTIRTKWPKRKELSASTPSDIRQQRNITGTVRTQQQ
eukprot:1969783-Amphidinium_carterae.1